MLTSRAVAAQLGWWWGLAVVNSQGQPSIGRLILPRPGQAISPMRDASIQVRVARAGALSVGLNRLVLAVNYWTIQSRNQPGLFITCLAQAAKQVIVLQFSLSQFSGKSPRFGEGTSVRTSAQIFSNRTTSSRSRQYGAA